MLIEWIVEEILREIDEKQTVNCLRRVITKFKITNWNEKSLKNKADWEKFVKETKDCIGL